MLLDNHNNCKREVGRVEKIVSYPIRESHSIIVNFAFCMRKEN